ncbi:MAG: glycosyltransferase family 4 protein, partial [bacterium]|nr:glycosyltransferase family 4 protein [bacterium]
MKIALDATYSIGNRLSGVGVYSHEILHGLAAFRPDTRFQLYYRPHRYARSLVHRTRSNCSRHLLWENWAARSVDLFHGLNQRMPSARWRRRVATFHDLFVLTADYSTEEFRRRFAVQARQAADRSDLIIAVSEFTANQ